MMPGLIALTRAPRSPQVTAAAWTRRWLARLDSALGGAGVGDGVRAEERQPQQVVGGCVGQGVFLPAVSGARARMCPAMLDTTSPAPPGAMIWPNSSRTSATPTRSTARIGPADA